MVLAQELVWIIFNISIFVDLLFLIYSDARNEAEIVSLYIRIFPHNSIQYLLIENEVFENI